MALTGAQVKQLRSMAHHLNPAIIIGKSDVNEGTVEQTAAYLEKHELVKCSVLDGSSLSAREAAEELAERCHADVVQVIGRKFSLYRESSRKDIEKIVDIQLGIVRRMLAENGLELNYTPAARAWIAEAGYDPMYGARPVKRTIQREVVNDLSKRILAGEVDRSRPISIDVDSYNLRTFHRFQMFQFSYQFLIAFF